MLQVEKYKANKAQKECKQGEIGKRKSKLLQVEELRKERRKRNAVSRNRERKKQKFVNICYNKLNIIVVKIFILRIILL
ncbi:hypothetical protein DN407_30220 (plasmid) [Bacillus sp. JAS24-2]|uniref:hypothetical protein n=1 Tax=Bacillus sp. JAS24-2 TaxID=2217832 RepID=UPI0011F00CDD|nr:hypothetical protein [Bacillus sp. JAS24-2]QEL82750.1 hypothetical protein DN407_30220 [Bacillus sp. JAS24-2]